MSVDSAAERRAGGGGWVVRLAGVWFLARVGVVSDVALAVHAVLVASGTNDTVLRHTPTRAAGARRPG